MVLVVMVVVVGVAVEVADEACYLYVKVAVMGWDWRREALVVVVLGWSNEVEEPPEI